MTTTIYLDVDGVLNAVTKDIPRVAKATGWDEWKGERINGYPILWATELIAALNDLAARGDVIFKWLTTWRADAAKILSPAIGITGQDWAVLDGDQHAWGGSRGWWKLEAIRADVEASNPEKFIWIDDDLSMESAALEWIHGRDNGLPVSPFMREGLTRDHLALITHFIDAELEAAA